MKDKGSALGLVLVFVTLLGVWLTGSMMIQNVGLNTTARIYKGTLVDNSKAVNAATLLAQLYKNQGCVPATLPAGYTCTSIPNPTICKTNKGKHLGWYKQDYDEELRIDSDDIHLRLHVKHHCTLRQEQDD